MEISGSFIILGQRKSAKGAVTMECLDVVTKQKVDIGLRDMELEDAVYDLTPHNLVFSDVSLRSWEGRSYLTASVFHTAEQLAEQAAAERRASRQAPSQPAA